MYNGDTDTPDHTDTSRSRAHGHLTNKHGPALVTAIRDAWPPKAKVHDAARKSVGDSFGVWSTADKKLLQQKLAAKAARSMLPLIGEDRRVE